MHLAEARLFTKFLAGASLLMSFHLGGHCRQGYYVTHSSFLTGCTRCLPGILAYHYHAHHPAAWTKISEYISNGPLVQRAHTWPTVLVSVEFNKKLVAPSTIIFRYHQHAVRPIPHHHLPSNLLPHYLVKRK